jgi:hypothetical protein
MVELEVAHRDLQIFDKKADQLFRLPRSTVKVSI